MWQVCSAETHPEGFLFAITSGDTVLAWCRREEDAQAIVEAHEAVPEIADLADSGLDWLDEARRRRIRALVMRVGDKLPEWKCLRPDAHPDGYPWAITHGVDRIAYVTTASLASFVVEVGANMSSLAAITRAAAVHADEDWGKQDVAVVRTLSRRLKRRLAESEP